MIIMDFAKLRNKQNKENAKRHDEMLKQAKTIKEIQEIEQIEAEILDAHNCEDFADGEYCTWCGKKIYNW